MHFNRSFDFENGSCGFSTFFPDETGVVFKVKTEYISRMANLEQEEERLKQQKSSIEASNEKLKRLTEIEVSNLP